MEKFRAGIVGAIALLFVAGLFLAFRADVAATSSSSLTGLATLRQMAQQSVEYDVAINNNKPTILEFYADWCTVCQSMALKLSNFKQQYGEAVNFVMLNIDEPQWSEQVKQYQVTGIPQLVLLDGDRAIVKTFVGEVPGSVLNPIFEHFSSSI
jgi:thiol-disulfide isomerase/thioredoxin